MTKSHSTREGNMRHDIGLGAFELKNAPDSRYEELKDHNKEEVYHLQNILQRDEADSYIDAGQRQ